MAGKFEDLKELQAMLDRGEITQAEYAMIKADLLAEETSAKDLVTPTSTDVGQVPQPTPPAIGESSGMTDQTRYFLIGTGVLMAIGSFMPWGQAGIFTVSGTQGDGVLTLIAGVIIAIIGIARRATAAAGIAVIVLAGGSGLIVLNIVAGFADTPGLIGTGLYVVGLAALFALIAGFKTIGERSRS